MVDCNFVFNHISLFVRVLFKIVDLDLRRGSFLGFDCLLLFVMALRKCPECDNWEGDENNEGFEELGGEDMYKCNACGHEFKADLSVEDYKDELG